MKVNLKFIRINERDGNVRLLLQAMLCNASGHSIHSSLFPMNFESIPDSLDETILDKIHFVLSRVDSNATKDMIKDAYKILLDDE